MIQDPEQPIRVGWFPANCVQLQSTSTPASTTASYQNTIGIDLRIDDHLKNISLSLALPRYIAIFPYEAQQDDELSFPIHAIFEILEDAGNSGWYKARYNNQIGLIPSTYVKPVEQSTPCKFQIDCLNTSETNLCREKMRLVRCQRDVCGLID